MTTDDSNADDMNGSITREHIRDVIQNQFGLKAKELQVDAIWALVHNQKDLILIAKTGFGKSIVFQAAPLMYSPIRSALIIMPLNALEEEQCKKLRAITGCKPFVLNGDSNNRSNLELIREGYFTHGKLSISVKHDNTGGH